MRVSDIRMPGTDGLTLLGKLRAERSGLPLILITGHGDVPLAVAAMKAGAVDFLEKPFEAEALLSAIEASLRREANPSAEGEDSEAARRCAEARAWGSDRRPHSSLSRWRLESRSEGPSIRRHLCPGRRFWGMTKRGIGS
jgi:DNA-binding NtrC family response regulator